MGTLPVRRRVFVNYNLRVVLTWVRQFYGRSRTKLSKMAADWTDSMRTENMILIENSEGKNGEDCYYDDEMWENWSEDEILI